jgi:hypothetical protein
MTTASNGHDVFGTTDLPIANETPTRNGSCKRRTVETAMGARNTRIASIPSSSRTSASSPIAEICSCVSNLSRF